ncbi:MAG: RNA-binding S4 domain-containing protein [Woeseia sp.]|nr:RNA-binding S4 domain-containing protein [Woeseia sp.]MBT8095486.1 RNA-binding S4 domain-containing protein [Woeseia sp.]NNE59475.1 RNA-binding S4 domain-containing protein [Woeseia sp.]NNL54592.1 RNA-binding S4 domain-containing protein [Woeseia sp.]
MDLNADTPLRVDRWLWFTRFYKTRTLAAAAVSGGHVRINGARARPGQRLQRGDVIEIIKGQLPYKMTVVASPERRGPAPEAQACYEECPAVIERRRQLHQQLKSDRLQMARTAGRPDKHTRRLLRQRNRED